MWKYFILLSFLLNSALSGISAQKVQDTQPLRVFLLGDYQAAECDWTSTDSSVVIIKTCVPDFSSQQLSWILKRQIIGPLRDEGRTGPGLCILNTGQLDIVLGVPPYRIIQNIDKMKTMLSNRDIDLVVMAPLCFSSASEYNSDLNVLSEKIRMYCDSSGVGFLDPNTVLSPEGILESKVVTDGYLINQSGCEKWNKLINEYLSNYDKEK